MPPETTRLIIVPPLTSVPATGLSLITLPDGTVSLYWVVTVPTTRVEVVMAVVAATCVDPTTLGTATAAVKVKLAVTFVALSGINRMQVPPLGPPVPTLAQAPPQLVNADPLDGIAYSVTLNPLVKPYEQVGPDASPAFMLQLSPVRLEYTRPPPVPPAATLTCSVGP